MRARGLKLLKREVRVAALVVAPHAGAWIETTNMLFQPMSTTASRPMRARGLKPFIIL